MFALDFHPRHSFPSLSLSWKTWNMANWQNWHNKFILRNQSSLLFNRKCQLLKIISNLLVMCLKDNLCIHDLFEVAEKYDFELFIKHATQRSLINTIIQQALLSSIYSTPVAQWNSPVLTWFQRKMINTDWKLQKTGGSPILLYGSSFNLISLSSRLSGQAHTK